MITTFNLFPRTTCLSCFLDRFVSVPSTAPIISGHCRSTTSLQPLPTYFPGTERRPSRRRPHPPPDSLRRSLCAPRRMPASAIVSHVVCSTVSSLGLQPGPCRPIGVQPLRVSRRLCVPPSTLCAAPIPVIIWALVSLGVFFVRGLGARAPPLPGSLSSQPCPPRYIIRRKGRG